MSTALTSPDQKTKTPLLQRGDILNGKWEVLEHLATGGKGEVYRARQTNLDREVVVKTVSVEFLAEFGDDQAEVQTEIQRFHREAMAMAQVRHPQVVQVYDQDAATIIKRGEQVTVQYVVMEFVPGKRTLRQTMPNEGFKDREREFREWVREYFLPILDGLETIHALGIIHRDMKPENVLLDGPIPKICDFGIAGGPLWTQLTKSHHVEGTITYMAPEQFMDLGETDARADVYALGKMLYEAVEGKMVNTKTACPLKGVCLSNPSTPFLKGLDIIVQEATAEDKERRAPSVPALRDALKRLLEKAEAAERPLLKGLHRKQVIAAIAVLFAIVVLSNIYHHFIMSHDTSPSVHTSSDTQSEKTGVASGEEGVPRENESPSPELTARDGTIMRLVAAGQVTLPAYVGAGGGKLVDVQPFYLDETEVTNYKYVEFLNQVISRIEVKNAVIYGDGQPWLVLGPVYGGYEPIIFQNGRFSVPGAAAASRPVVKVTGYGAAAYASFYGKRLQTEMEWLYVATRTEDGRTEDEPTKGDTGPTRDVSDLEKEMEAWLGAFKQKTGQGAAAPQEGQSALPGDREALPPSGQSGPSAVPYPVLDFPPNVDGVRGLMRNVSEWGARIVLASGGKPQLVVLGGVRGTMLAGSSPFPGIAHDPAMAFEDVGFRCAMDK